MISSVLEARDLSSFVVGTLDSWEIEFRVFSPFEASGRIGDENDVGAP